VTNTIKKKKKKKKNHSNELNEFILELAVQNQLESLNLDGIKISLHVIDSIKIFENLKELIIDNWNMMDEVISRVVKNINSNLTHLLLGCCKTLVTNAGIINAIKYFSTLEVFKIQLKIIECFNLYKIFFFF